MKGKELSELAQVLGKSRSAFIGVGIFSFFINMLMLVSPLYMLQIYDRVLASRNETTLWVLTLVAVFLIVVYAALETMRSRVLVRISGQMDSLLNARVFTALFKSAVRGPAGGSGQAIRDLDGVRDFLSGQGLFAFFDAPWMPIYLAAIFLIDPLLGWVATAGGIILFSLAVLTEIATRDTLGEASAANMRAGHFVEVSLRNVEAIEAMGMVPAMLKRWQGRRSRMLQLQSLASDRAGVITAMSKFTRVVLQIAILGFGAYLVIHNHITAGLMIAASIMMGRALAPVEIAVGSWKHFLTARTAYERLNALLKAVPAQRDFMHLPAPLGNLQVEQAIVVPPGATVPALKGVGFTVAAGDIVGIIGPSAAGKSTLARLLVGVWPPYAGKVRIDGADIMTWDRERLGPYIGYLPQDVELFEGTIAENIARFGEVVSEQVILAAQRAGVHELILKLPAGYDTQIGPGGQTLSGGQRQRVGLARALYGDPVVIVLDEPNSNLDNDGEAALARTVADLKTRKRTTLVITHRPSLLASVDYIMVMREGMIEKFGPRDEILGQYLRPSAVPNTPPESGPERGGVAVVNPV
ncbi:MAG: type I secretion system permease/ATPase [Alphaproteobacteria bacterium]